MNTTGGLRRWAAELGLAAVCLIWGSTFVVVKNALADVSTVLFLALRFSMAAILLGSLYVWRRRGKPGHIDRRGVLAGVVTGGFLYAGYLFQTLGLHHTTPATSGFITGLYIAIVPMLSAVVYRRMPGLSEWVGVGLATAGMGLLSLNAADFAVGRGELLTLWCAFAFAAHILALGHFSQRMDTDWLTLLQIASCAAIGLGSFWWVEPAVLRLTPAVTFALVLTSILATAVAFWIQTWAQARTTATRAAVIFSLEPVFAWLTSWAVEGEIVTPRSMAGAACIFAGILFVELKPMRQR